MAIDAVSGTTPQPASGTQAKQAGVLGKDDFLKILVGQIRNMDPMNPGTDQEYMGQMTQFSILEQISNLAASNERQQSLDLIGKTVSYTDKDGASFQGQVEKVDIDTAGKTKLTVAGKSGIALEAVREVS